MNSISWSVYNMVSDSEKVILSAKVKELSEVRDKLSTASDEEYINLKSEPSEYKIRYQCHCQRKDGC